MTEQAREAGKGDGVSEEDAVMSSVGRSREPLGESMDRSGVGGDEEQSRREV